MALMLFQLAGFIRSPISSQVRISRSAVFSATFPIPAKGEAGMTPILNAKRKGAAVALTI